MTIELVLTALILIIAFITVIKGIRIVPQSEVFVIERFGKFTKILNPGLNLIIPFIDLVRHKISILERQLPAFSISVITKDNVEVDLESTVFYRVIDAAKSVYRIEDDQLAIHTAATSIVRSAAGKLELDDLQSSRETMNKEISEQLKEAALIWGIEITRTEITDVSVDKQTKDAQRQQLNAERQRRAVVAEAEGAKTSVELDADAELYQAEKRAEAIRVTAEAEAFAIKAKANAQAEQTRVIAAAISENGQPAIDFEILTQQVNAIGEIAKSNNTKTVIMPTDITKALGSLDLISQFLNRDKD
jgi:regulator of protease activity HflC (stomatin/prohibitin superfamily)